LKKENLEEAMKLFKFGLELLQDSIKPCYVGFSQVNKLSSDVAEVQELMKDP